MPIPENVLRAVEEGISVFGRKFAPESWARDHDSAMRCRDLEERLASGLANLARLDEEVCKLRLAIKDDAVVDAAHTALFAVLSVLFRFVTEYIRHHIRDLQSLGFSIDGAAEWESSIRPIEEFLCAFEPGDPDFASRVSEGVNFVRSIPLNIETGEDGPTGAESAKSYLGTIRLPDPPFETGEGSPHVDLPVLGPRFPVKVRWGPPPLPDPFDD